MAGIYFHIPFCKQACHYCNFHFSTSLKYKDEMVNALIQELILRKDYLNRASIQSIYFGGGTPSLLDIHSLERIFDSIFRHFDVHKDAEITLEANPDDLTSEKVRSLEQSPVNRLSIGIQSFFEEDLRWMNRAHNAQESKSCIKSAREHGFDNISIDLIHGIPVSNLERWERNIQKAIDLDIPHISSYALTIEPKTALHHFVKKGTVIPLPDDDVVVQFNHGIQSLTQSGYVHYEISNFAKPGFEAVHNSNYWKSYPYLGIGPSAHSYNMVSRSMNVANNMRYLKAVSKGELTPEVEVLSPQDIYNETVMTRLRTIWGIDINDLNFPDYFLSKAKVLLKKGWIQCKENRYILTPEGKKFADAATVELFMDTEYM